MTPATYDDVNLILKLYDMRREEQMRTARVWFSANFRAKSMAEYNRMCPRGSGMNAHARQVITYWEMVASFICSGVLNQELFFQSGRELLFVWIRVEPILEEWRASYKDPEWLKNLETVGTAFAEYMKRRGVEGYESFVARVRG
jgi:hypothetical protein